MPLVIITGLPCSGKTHRTQQIADALRKHIDSDPANSKRIVLVVNSHHASSDTKLEDLKGKSSDLRDQIYNNAAQEKTARAEEFSTIKRALNKDNVVIADCLNYIKGYRYQLWCEAKAAGTRCCVVHVAAREDECKRWNNERLKAWGRPQEVVEDGQRQEHDGTRAGKDVLGDLMPESHTAVYGDRVADDTRSRSSSMDGAFDGEVNRPHDDSMTLKSLYISDKPIPASAPPPLPFPNGHETLPAPVSALVPEATPPDPTTAPPYTPSTLSSLLMRYEPPSPFSRWDTPLFTIPSSDANPPYSSIWEAIYPPPSKPTSKKALSQLSTKSPSTTTPETATNQTDTVKQHAATVLPTATSSDALQTLESTTLEVVQSLLTRARELGASDGEGGLFPFTLPSSPARLSSPTSTISTDAQQARAATQEDEIEVEISVPPGTVLSQPMLQRLRRKYTQIQRGSIAHGRGYVAGRRNIVEGFVGFLDAELSGD